MDAYLEPILVLDAGLDPILIMDACLDPILVMDAGLDPIRYGCIPGFNSCYEFMPWAANSLIWIKCWISKLFFYWKPTSRIDAQAAHSHQLSHFLPATEYIQFEGWRAEEGYLEGQWHRASTGTLYGVNIGVGINQKNYVGEASSSFMEVGPGIHKSAHHLI